MTAPAVSENHPHKWRCRVCHIELSLPTKVSLEILSHYKTDSHLVREHRNRMETPGLPLFGKNEQELTGPALVEAPEKAELAYSIVPILGEWYLLPGPRKLPVAIYELDPLSVACSLIPILLTGLQQGGDSSVLSSLWSNLSLEVRGPVKVPQHDWNVARIFVSISCHFKQLLTWYVHILTVCLLTFLRYSGPYVPHTTLLLFDFHWPIRTIFATTSNGTIRFTAYPGPLIWKCFQSVSVSWIYKQSHFAQRDLSND